MDGSGAGFAVCRIKSIRRVVMNYENVSIFAGRYTIQTISFGIYVKSGGVYFFLKQSVMKVL